MASKVFFTNLRTKAGNNLLDKMERLVKKAGIEQINFADKFTAIKLHFGEPGNLAYLRANYVARMVQLLKSKQARVFMTDSNTLYSGRRANAVDHFQSAMENGFNPIAVPCPVIIADGLKAVEYREMPVKDGKYCKTAKIGSAIADADIIISMTHFKGHEQTGFGGALKNLGMGSAAAPGKMELHTSSQPRIEEKACTACGQCVKYCASKAVALNSRKKAQIDYDKCVGCGQCIAVCQYDAACPVWDGSSELTGYKIAEYTQAVIGDKPNFHVSFIMNVSPYCDCWDSNDAAIVPDLGMAASFDPVALDRACADMVNAATPNANTRLQDRCADDICGKDLFKLLHPKTNWLAGLQYAEQIGLGTMDYELITV